MELEAQNEELLRVQAELTAAREHYFELYDQAPVGYCTLSQEGVILEANLTATLILGVRRGGLAGELLARFVAKKDRKAWQQILGAFQ
jgi:PAS domain-containing protein